MTGLARLGLLACCLLSVPGAARAQDMFEFSGDRTSVVLAEGRERTVLEGNAEVVSDDVALSADRIELSGTDFRYAETTGNVVVVDASRGLTINADALTFDRDTEDSRASGQVLVEDEENDLLLKGGFLETRDGGDLILVQVAVRVLRDDLTARSQFLRYRRPNEVLELSGFPVVYWRGDEYRAARIVLNLETEEIELQGQVRGSVVIEEDEEDEEPDDAETDEPGPETDDPATEDVGGPDE